MSLAQFMASMMGTSCPCLVTWLPVEQDHRGSDDDEEVRVRLKSDQDVVSQSSMVRQDDELRVRPASGMSSRSARSLASSSSSSSSSSPSPSPPPFTARRSSLEMRSSQQDLQQDSMKQDFAKQEFTKQDSSKHDIAKHVTTKQDSMKLDVQPLPQKNVESQPVNSGDDENAFGADEDFVEESWSDEDFEDNGDFGHEDDGNNKCENVTDVQNLLKKDDEKETVEESWSDEDFDGDGDGDFGHGDVENEKPENSMAIQDLLKKDDDLENKQTSVGLVGDQVEAVEVPVVRAPPPAPIPMAIKSLGRSNLSLARQPSEEQDIFGTYSDNTEQQIEEDDKKDRDAALAMFAELGMGSAPDTSRFIAPKAKPALVQAAPKPSQLLSAALDFDSPAGAGWGDDDEVANGKSGGWGDDNELGDDDIDLDAMDEGDLDRYLEDN